jgi:hypothetical protein
MPEYLFFESWIAFRSMIALAVTRIPPSTSKPARSAPSAEIVTV